jgi:CRISPR-associated protein Cas1
VPQALFSHLEKETALAIGQSSPLGIFSIPLRMDGSVMARSYYIFQSGRLRRKGNTLYLEWASSNSPDTEESSASPTEQSSCDSAPTDEQETAGQVHEPDATSDPAPSQTDTACCREVPQAEVTGDLTRTETHNVPPPPPDSSAGSQNDSPGSPLAARRIIPVEDVAEIFVFGELSFNTRLLNFLAQKAIPIHIFNYYGFYSGSFCPRQTNVSGHLLVRQVEHYTDASKRLVIAREIARGACHNLRRNLLYYRNRGKAVEAAISSFDQAAAEIDQADSIAALMGAEGRLREAYYQAFNEILQLETPFLKRVKRPPDNLVNTLLSFGNSLLYSAVLSQIYHTPLHPAISYLHEPATRRFSLALDLAEIFKPLIVDKMIFTLINRQMISEADLVRELAFAALKERARKTIVQEFERRLQTTVKHRRLARHVSYRGFIRLECYKLVRHLLGIEPYQALRAWW